MNIDNHIEIKQKCFQTGGQSKNVDKTAKHSSLSSHVHFLIEEGFEKLDTDQRRPRRLVVT